MHVIKILFEILVILNVNVISHVILVSIYIHYENCKCRKRRVDKLVDEGDENIDEISLVKINSTKCKHNSCILYVVLFSIFFTINVGIAAYFVYYKYVKQNQENVSKYDCLSNNNLINKLLKWEK